jgi:hypothetical protein
MASIVETISGDRRIRLANEEWVRKMSFGGKWNKLRVTVRYGINGTSNITSPTLFIGVCAGLTNTFKSSNTDFCVGLTFPGSNGGAIANLNYNSGPPAWFVSASSLGYNMVSRAGNTTTRNFPTSQTTFHAATANNPPMCSAVDIVRTGSVYTVYQWFNPNSQANVQAGNSQRQMIVGADSETGSPWDAMSATVPSSSNTFTSSLVCDCVSVFWDQATTLEISDIQVTRFQ